MHTRPPLFPVSYVSEHLAYDPITGDLTWRVPVGRHVKAGDLAGTVTRTGQVYVSFKKRKFHGPYLALALYQGAWPDHAVGLRSDNDPTLNEMERDKAREDLRLENLVVRATGRRVEIDPKSVYRRDLRERTKMLNQEAADRAAKAKITDEHPNITWGEYKHQYSVTDLPHWRRRNHLIPANRSFFRSKDWNEAVAASDKMEYNLDLLAENPCPETTHPWANRCASATPGAGLTYLTLRYYVLYNPTNGEFIWASGPQIGLQADQPKSSGRFRYIEVANHRLEAHRLAWFFTTGIWPKPKTIHHFDGDPNNNRIENLKYVPRQFD
jgi:hypothetical protein